MKGKRWDIMCLYLQWNYQGESIGLEKEVYEVFQVASYLSSLIFKIAFMYLKGRVEVWFEGFILSNEDVENYDEFMKGICMRLESKKDMVKNSIR